MRYSIALAVVSVCLLNTLCVVAAPHAQRGNAASPAPPEHVTLGQTFPIAEPDLLEEIRARVAATDWRSKIVRNHERDAAFDSADLPSARKNNSRLFDPTYVLPNDIRRADGTVLFARGTRINVYDRIHMPGRLIVIGPQPRDLAWLRAVAKPTERDKVLLATGNVLHARRSTKTRLFRLDARIIERFGLRATPSIVEQAGNRLRVREYALP